MSVVRRLIGNEQSYHRCHFQKVRIPSPQMEDVKSDEGGSSDDDGEDEEEEGGSELGRGRGLSKVPKLHMRPKTAPSVESRRGARYVTWNEAQQHKAQKRPFSGGGNGARRIQVCLGRACGPGIQVRLRYRLEIIESFPNHETWDVRAMECRGRVNANVCVYYA